MTLSNQRTPIALLIRRFCAFAALFGVLVALIERSLPDIHDGDGSSASVLTLEDHEAPLAPGAGGQSIPPSHPVPHADHCVHAHTLALAVENASGVSVPPHGDAPTTVSDRLVSVSMPTHLRPPIA